MALVSIGSFRGALIISSYKKLPVGKIVLAAFWIAYERRKALLRALILPFTVLTLAYFLLFLASAMQTDMLSPEPRSGIHVTLFLNTVYLIFYAVVSSLVFTPFAIPCHRIVLLGSNSIASAGGWRWARRETRFALTLVILFIMIYLGTSLLLVLLAFPISIISSILQNPRAVSYLVSYVSPLLAIAATIYIFSRLTIILPSIAIDEPLTVRSAWHMSRCNGVRLLAIITLFFYVQETAHILVPQERPILAFAAIALGNVLAIFGIVALSLSYAELRKYHEKR